jgi:hypothetical protein
MPYSLTVNGRTTSVDVPADDAQSRMQSSITNRRSSIVEIALNVDVS